MKLNWTIGKRLFAGFSFVLAALAGIGGFGYLAVEHGADNLASTIELSHEASSLSEAALYLTRARVNIQKFVRLAHHSEFESFSKRIAESRKILVDLSDELHAEQRADVEALVKDLDAYNAEAHKVDDAVLKITEVFTKTLDVHGPRAEKALSELFKLAEARGASNVFAKVASVRRNLLLSRIRAQQFYIDGEEKRADEGQEFISEALEILNDEEQRLVSAQERSFAKEASDSIDQYMKGWTVLAEAGKIREQTLEEQLDVRGPALTDKIFEIVKRLDLKSEALAATAQREASRTEGVVLLSVLGSLLIGGGASWWITRSINQALAESANRLSQGASEINSASGQVAQASQSLAAGTEQQAASVEETSSTLKTLANGSQHTAENTVTARSFAGEARGGVESGVEAMNDLADAMVKIQTSSGEVSNIIKVIDEIAFQTNLLALNAAVEAARAGEAGRGFAVVAEEVRSLAQRSAAAARESTSKIQASVSSSEAGAKLAETVKERLGVIAGQVEKLDAIINEVSDATTSQSSGVTQMMAAMGEIDKVTQSNASTAEQSAAAAEQLSAQVASMNELASKLAALVGSAKP